MANLGSILISMAIDLRNINTVWASIIVETLQRLGLKTVIICPGSRSTPLTLAFARNSQVESIAILDERSAAFWALGMTKSTGLPVALVCTSGTAGANFYPAIIEAKESRLPLIILTADRPSEMRDCHSGQTINQVKLYSNYPQWQVELATPALDINMLIYLRQTMIQAWANCLWPAPGPVHLNIPFRDPLVPSIDPEVEQLKDQLTSNFFDHCQFNQPAKYYNLNSWDEWLKFNKGLIIVGINSAQINPKYCWYIGQLSQALGWPVLADALTPLRNYREENPYLISTYDLILRNAELADQLIPEIVIQIGDLPTSKELRLWMTKHQPRRWIIEPSQHNLDALHGRTIHLRLSVEELVKSLPSSMKFTEKSSIYCQQWGKIEQQFRQAIDQTFSGIETMIEPKIAWLLPQILPEKTPLFIANSMPVRDVEFFWQPNQRKIQPFCNRGANGIDGTLSTAIGIAHRHQSSVMLTGDLALLHDTNGFLGRDKLVGHLTIILVNNNGGGIFEMLPIATFDPPFEEFFATPQNINFAQLASTYNITYQKITNWQQLLDQLNPLPLTGIRLLEIQTDRKYDAQWRKENLNKLAKNQKIR